MKELKTRVRMSSRIRRIAAATAWIVVAGWVVLPAAWPRSPVIATALAASCKGAGHQLSVSPLAASPMSGTTQTTIVLSDGTTLTVTTTINPDGTVTTVITDENGNILDRHTLPPGGGGHQSDDRVKSTRISWKEILRQ